MTIWPSAASWLNKPNAAPRRCTTPFPNGVGVVMMMRPSGLSSLTSSHQVFLVEDVFNNRQEQNDVKTGFEVQVVFIQVLLKEGVFRVAPAIAFRVPGRALDAGVGSDSAAGHLPDFGRAAPHIEHISAQVGLDHP